MSKKQYIGIIILAVMILGFLFYWYEFRPYQVKKNCFETAKDVVRDSYKDERASVKEWQERFDFHYKNCLRTKGL